ncbi:MAG: phosphoglucomutase/phosphomannomutase family protein [Caldilineaceae bacterium]|nr:phosphoglucomutase/phosphomannomutase family protein [Caldilineaceae bacterium]
MSIKFGTDGWRAVISEDFTFKNVRRVARAVAEQTLREWDGLPGQADRRRPSFVIGFDTRFLSDRYAIAVAEVFAAAGIEVWLAQADAPTPMISYAIVDKRADGGIMITASHNPPRYNGIKLKSAYGGSAAADYVKQVEMQVNQQPKSTLPKTMPLVEAIERGLVRRFDPLPAYKEHLMTLVDFDTIRMAHLCVAVDAMYGAGRVYLKRLLEDAGCRVTELRGEMNPGFNGIHPEPIARHLRPLMLEMTTGRYHLGLATDGDADRIGAVDPSGRFIDPHAIMALILEHLVRNRGLYGSIVKTVSTTQMLNRLASRYALPIHETPVGFHHIADLMQREPVLIGGEESGGISMHGHIPEGDGILMGLLLAEIVAGHGKTLGLMLDELMAAPEIGPFCYARHDHQVRPFQKAALVNGLMHSLPAQLVGYPLDHASDLDGVKYVLEDGSWLLIRPSGTEPLLRIYAEARSEKQVELLLRLGAEMADQQIQQLQLTAG